MIIDVFVYNSDTDNGVTYASGNIDTNPKELIKLFTEHPLGDGMSISPAIATVKFTKQYLNSNTLKIKAYL